LRRLRSAGLSLRDFGGAFEPVLLRPSIPAPPVALIGARRLASRQMNAEIPARMTIAPIAITSALLPLRELDPDEFVVTGATV
jgi:hypothetical protein